MRQVDAQVAACEAQLRAEVQAAWAELALGQSADAPGERPHRRAPVLPRGASTAKRPGDRGGDPAEAVHDR